MAASGSSSASSPLLYSCIAYQSTILCEHTTSTSLAISLLASVVLSKITHKEPQKLTYTHDQNFIHYIADAPSEYPTEDPGAGGLTYLCVAKSDLGRRIPFDYLLEIKRRFIEAYPPSSTDFASLPPYGAANLNKKLKDLMHSYGNTKSGQTDAITTVQNEINNVRGIMTENIERVLERGERLDTLVDKTDRLGQSSHDFRVRSHKLRRRMWWKNVRLMAILSVTGIFLLYLLIGAGCGLPGWGHCV